MRICVTQVNLLQYYKMVTEEGQDTWYDACLYKCQPCWTYETTKRSDFIQHLATAHDLGQTRYAVGV